ncbi:phage tail tape measure protein [Yinghuangia aomiensis]
MPGTTNRVVSVSYRAQMGGYLTPLRQGTVATRNFGRAAERAGQQAALAMAQSGQSAASMAITHAQAVQQQLTAGTTATSHAVAGWQAQVSAGAAATSQAISSGVGTWQSQISGGASAVSTAVTGWQSQVTAGAHATGQAIASGVGTSAAALAGASAGVGASATSWMSQVSAGAAAAGRAVSSTTTAATAASRALTRSARESNAAWSEAGAGIAAQGAGLALAFGMAVRSTMEFDKQMSAARAVLSPTAREFDQLRQAAIKAGMETSFTASEAAEAITELGRAGVSTADILGGGLRGALDLAAAGQVSTAQAAETAADAMTMFKLTGADLTHVADLLAAGANKSSTDVHGLALALRQAGLLASQTGLSIEDTTGALAMFAAAGLKGSDAGTSLKVMLQMLNPKSEEAKGLMEQLGFTAYDANGNFIGLAETAEALKNSMSKLTPEARNAAMATIFGTDAVRAATILYDGGAAGVRKWVDAVNDQGAAARTSSTMLDNLSGDVEALGGAWEVAMINSGSGVNKILREMVQAITDLLNAYNSLPAPLQTAITVVGGLGAVLLLVAGAAMMAWPRILAMRAAMQSLAVQAPRTSAALRGAMLTLGGLGAMLGVAAGIVSIFGGKKREATVDVQQFTAAIKQDSGALGQNTRALALQELERLGAGKAAAKFGIAMEDVVAASLGDAEALARVNARLAEVGQHMGDYGGDIVDVAKQAGGLRDAIGEVTDATKDGQAAQQRAKEVMGETGDQSKITADQLGEQKSAADQLREALDKLNGVHISSTQSAISFQDSVAKLRDSIDENGRSLDIETAKGRENMSAFLSAASAANDHAQAVADETGSIQSGSAALGEHIEQLRKTLGQMGYNKDQIDKLIDTYLKVPTNVSTDVSTNANGAAADVGRLNQKLDNLPRNVTISVSVGVQKAFDKLSSGLAGFMADGGIRPPRSVRTFAEGSHVAQIARGGDWRIWAEPETLGEAYIPFAPSKRARSTAILSRVARSFGYDLAPRQGRMMSARSLVGAAAPSAQPMAGTPGMTFSIERYYAGDASARDVATELYWQQRSRG